MGDWAGEASIGRALWQRAVLGHAISGGLSRCVPQDSFQAVGRGIAPSCCGSRSAARRPCGFTPALCKNGFSSHVGRFALPLPGAMFECGQILGAGRGSMLRCLRGLRIRAECSCFPRIVDARGQLAAITATGVGAPADLMDFLTASAMVCAGNASVTARASGFVSAPHCVRLLGFGLRFVVAVGTSPDAGLGRLML